MKIIPKRPPGDPNDFDRETIIQEMIRISDDTPGTQYGLCYFLQNYICILDKETGSWIPFNLWNTEPGGFDNQLTAAKKIEKGGKFIILKARQLGMTWLVLATFLRQMLFFPIVTALFISKGEKESTELLKIRLRGMYYRLPAWMKAEETPIANNTEWHLSNGSSVRSLSTKQGDSFATTHVLIDEAALIHRSGTTLHQVMLNVSPTISKNGTLILLSKADKQRSNSTFNGLFRAATRGEIDYTSIFLPYYIHPDRDQEWYEQQRALSLATDGTLDFIHETFPSTPEEALAPLSVSKRLPHDLLYKNYIPETPLARIDGSEVYWLNDEIVNDDIPIIHGLKLYRLPEEQCQYLVIIDPAEGGKNGDDSCAMVLRVDNKEEVATLAIKAEPAQIAYFADILAHFYNNASVIHERNNHGHAVKLWFEDHSDFYLLEGWDHNEKKPGWLNNSLGKNLGYDKLADVMAKESCIIHDLDTYSQLASIERVTLRAPKSEPDDRAVCFMIGCAAIEVGCIKTFRLDFIKIGG